MKDFSSFSVVGLMKKAIVWKNIDFFLKFSSYTKGLLLCGIRQKNSHWAKIIEFPELCRFLFKTLHSSFIEENKNAEQIKFRNYTKFISYFHLVSKFFSFFKVIYNYLIYWHIRFFIRRHRLPKNWWISKIPPASVEPSPRNSS